MGDVYTIRLCKTEEYSRLINFISCNVDSNHIFCQSKEMFEFQFGKGGDGVYDVAIAVHNHTGEIHAMMGFIRSTRYHRESGGFPSTIYGVTWQRRKDVDSAEIKGIGMKVLMYVLRMFPQSTYITLGLSQHSCKIYKNLGFMQGVLDHYYIPNVDIKEYIIGKNISKNIPSERKYEVSIKEIQDVSGLNIISNYVPYKDIEFLINRYVNHPFYEYKLLGIITGEIVQYIIVARLQSHKGAHCLRLVDVVGTINPELQLFISIQHILKKYHAEYIDLLCTGIDEEELLNIGFTRVSGKTIIPNYFQPFIHENINLNYAYKSNNRVVIFRGDGDQDRPRSINEKCVKGESKDESEEKQSDERTF